MMDQKIINKVLSKKMLHQTKLASWQHSLLLMNGGNISHNVTTESYLLNEKIITEWSDHEVPT